MTLIDPDLTLWSFWWEFNKDPYLNLKGHIQSKAVSTGEGDFLLGQGLGKGAKDTLRPTRKQVYGGIVPALLRMLERETDNDIVTGCMIALAKIGDESSESGRSEFEQVLKKFLADGNQEISESAALALGILANDASVQILTDLLADSATGRKWVGKNEVDFRRRSFAAYGLALIGNRSGNEEVRRQIVATLADALESVQSSTQDIKVACLIGLGLVPLETLGDASVGEDGSSLPPQVSREAQIAFVKRYLQDDDNYYLVRAHAPVTLARLLGDLPPDRFEEHKLEIAQDLVERLGKRSKEKIEVIQSCVLALGLLGDCDEDRIDEEIRKTLVGFVEDSSDAQAKHFSRIALGQVGGKSGTTGSPNVGRAQVGDALLKSLSRGNNLVRQWSGLGVGVMGRMIATSGTDVASPALASALRAELEDAKNPEDVGAYSIAVGILRDIESRNVLLKKMDKIQQDDARGYVAVGLGLIGAREAIEPIQSIVVESKYRPDLLKQAAIALGLLGDKTLVPTLIEMLVDAKSLATQASITSALGFIGDARSVEPLIEMLENDRVTPRARGFAAVALGIVGDKEALPWNSKIAVDLNYRASTRTLNDAEGGTGVLNIL